jgi:excisionase family DNA binding protein
MRLDEFNNLITMTEAAALLGVSKSTFSRIAAAENFRIESDPGHKQVKLVHRADVLEYRKRRRSNPSHGVAA